jgi:hypothetical protein
MPLPVVSPSLISRVSYREKVRKTVHKMILSKSINRYAIIKVFISLTSISKSLID